MEEAFEYYLKNYDKNDPDINYKYHHSYRVMENSKFLSDKLKLSEKDKQIAEIIALYHDIGRFEQDKKFNSYNDLTTFDHADYGEYILINEGLIKQIPIEEEYYNIIAKAVKNHNKYSVEKGLSDEELFQAKLIRDADKIDILYAASKKILTSKAFDYNNKEFNISEEIKIEFKGKNQIKRKKTPITKSERVLALIAFTFDINFKESAKYILDNKILDNFYNLLINKEKYKEYFDLAANHLKEMIKC